MSGFVKLASNNAPREQRARVFFVDAPSKNLICLLCQEVFEDPVISECGHTFCRRCIAGHVPSNCPVHQDRKLSVVVDNLAVREQVGELNVRCQYGVRWGDVDSGVNGDDTSSSIVGLTSGSNHNNNVIVGIPLEDGCPAVVKFSEKMTHEQGCEFRPVPCPNNIGCPLIRKKDLPDHLLECGRTRCRYQACGCSFSGNEVQLALHQASECRFTPMEEYFRQMDERLQEQHDHLKEKDQEIAFLRSVVSKLTEKVDELEQKVDSLQEASARTELDVEDLRRDLNASLENRGRRGSQFDQEFASSGDAGGLRCIGTFVGHEGPVWCLAESGGCLFSGSSDTTIKVWDILETYQCMKTLVGHKDIVLSLHAADGKLYSGSSDCCVNVWSTDTYSLLRRVKAHDNAVCTIISNDDKLFTGSLMKIKVWDLASVALLKELTGTNWFRALATHGDQLFAGSKEAVMVWNLSTYDCVRTLDVPGGSIYSISIFDDRYLVGGSQENAIHVWDLVTYESRQELRGHVGAVYCLSSLHRIPPEECNPAGEDTKPVLASGGYDRSLRVWTLDRHGQFSCVQTLSRHSGSVSCLLSDGGRVYSGAIDSTIKLWCY